MRPVAVPSGFQYGPPGSIRAGSAYPCMFALIACVLRVLCVLCVRMFAFFPLSMLTHFQHVSCSLHFRCILVARVV